MCKKGLFLPHTSARNEVFEFFGHFPEAQKLVDKVGIFPNTTWVGQVFNHSWGVPDGTKTWFLEVIWVKMCCFWPVEVSETHF